ncbi:MAG: hypothetical protein IPG45_00530 [Deltaproteobacteria bacterium]|jgi:hypothetical protein|nr:hypothetical protein [Kofleriaceae bacterium]MBK6682931.1 hypothetical protein [Deltaproteobacteria bacterium]MCK6588688.1 hypothetical protein [Polyangiaceae bacterium]
MRRAHATSAAALALSVGFGGCRGAASQVDTFVHEAERVRVATTPAHARVTWLGESAREPLRVCQEWRLGDQVDWVTFAVDASRALAATYRCAADAEVMRCTRSLPGDRFSLEFAHDGPGRVRAKLEARPD